MPDAVEPGDATGLTQDEYVRWLINYIRWVERDNASHGGVAGVAGSIEQQSAAVELHKLLISEPELADIFYQEVMSAAPQLAAWLTHAGGDIAIYSAGWVLSQVRIAGRSERRFPRFKDLPSRPGMERHHLIEKRFADVIGVKSGDIPADYLPPQEHRGPGSVTSELRERLPYGGRYTPQEIWNAHKEVYMEKGRYDWIEAIWPYFQALEVMK